MSSRSGRFAYYLGLGSNVGNRSSNLIQGLHHIRAIARVKNTSFLYDTKPMYVEQQSSFLNAAVHIECNLDPCSLLSHLKHIEQTVMKRQQTVRNGPRIIDIDILCGFDADAVAGNKEIFIDEIGDDQQYRLRLPHPRMTERNFVLTPLCDILPDYRPESTSSSSTSSLSECIQHLLSSHTNNNELHNLTQVLPLQNTSTGEHEILHEIDNSDQSLEHRTLLMAILNITPDSFSDGGQWMKGTDAILKCLEQELFANATEIDILDVGGQSTRPQSQRLDAQQELDRVMPVLQAIQRWFADADGGVDIPVSIDTYHAQVAKECVLHGGGASIVNDVSGGTLDDAMLSTVGELGVPYVCMHMRGTPSTMQTEPYLNYGDEDADVVPVVRQELMQRVQRAQAHGIAAWNIILDPGIGFAKTSTQNQYLLHRLQDVKGTTKYPILSGCSRKSFLNPILGQHVAGKTNDCVEKVIGTQCGVTASILSGADIVRVHDLYQMHIARKVTDSIFNVNHDKKTARVYRHGLAALTS